MTAAELESLADRLHGLAIRMLRTVRTEDVVAGMSGPRLSALSVVVFRGPILIGELAAAEQVRPPTMTRLVQAMEAEGLVRREQDAADRRQVRIVATARGKRLLEQGRQRRVRALATRLEPLSATARADLARTIAALEKLFRPPPRPSERTSGKARG